MEQAFSHLNASSQAFSTVLRSLVVIFCLTLRPSMVVFMLKQYLKALSVIWYQQIPKIIQLKVNTAMLIFMSLRFQLISGCHFLSLGVIVCFELLSIIYLKPERKMKKGQKEKLYPPSSQCPPSKACPCRW